MKLNANIINEDDIVNKKYVDDKVDEISASLPTDAYITKIPNAIAGNIAVLSSDGNLVDGEMKFSIYNGGLRITYDDGL